MGLTRLELKNFKKFRSLSLSLESGITVILGENSSGKSSIIKSILGLKQTIASTNEHECWAAHGDYVDLGTFQDYINKKDISRSFTVALTISKSSILSNPISRRLLADDESLTLAFTYDHDHTTSQSRILSVKAFYGEESNACNWEIRRQKTRKNYSVETTAAFLKRYNEVYGRPSILEFHLGEKLVISHVEKLIFQRSNLSRKYSHTQLLRIINETISSFSGYIEKQVFYLAPLRSSPSRSYIRSSHNLAVGVSGEHTPSVLANLEKRAKKVTGGESKHLRNIAFFNRSLAKVFPGHSATIKTFDELVKIKISSKDTSGYLSSDKSDTITDVGFGFSQVFPILVQMAVMPEDATLIIEQPELHLHPMAQTRLASVIAESAARGRRFIIETHSEHFVRGMQIAVSESRTGREPKLCREGIQFIYVRRSGSSPYEILDINEFGEFTSEWPTGFFDESYRSIRTLLENRMKG